MYVCIYSFRRRHRHRPDRFHPDRRTGQHRKRLAVAAKADSCSVAFAERLPPSQSVISDFLFDAVPVGDGAEGALMNMFIRSHNSPSMPDFRGPRCNSLPFFGNILPVLRR